MKIEDLVNWLNDNDAGWQPFLFLRPAKDEPMSDFRVAAIALLYGVAGGMLANVLLALAGQASRVSVLAFPLLTSMGFFMVYRVTFAHFWNRRALKLARVPARRATARRRG